MSYIHFDKISFYQKLINAGFDTKDANLLTRIEERRVAEENKAIYRATHNKFERARRRIEISIYNLFH